MTVVWAALLAFVSAVTWGSSVALAQSDGRESYGPVAATRGKPAAKPAAAKPAAAKPAAGGAKPKSTAEILAALRAEKASGGAAAAAPASTPSDAPAAKPAAAGKPRALKKGFMFSTLSSDTAKKLSLKEKFQLLKDAGFDGVEVMSAMNQQEVLAARDATGLEIPSLIIATHWSHPLTSPNPSAR